MASQPYTTVKYAKDVFSDSLITGIPQIVQTHNITRKILKTLVLSMCLIGFVYQTTEFMKIFWNYPTVLDIKVEYPEIIESPAITYCNLNGIKKSMYCDKFPESCATPSNPTEFCSKLPEICKTYGNKDLQHKLEFPVGDGLFFEQTASVEELDEMGHKKKDILKHCMQISADGTEYVECEWNTIRMRMSDGNTGYRNCYTLFSSATSTKLKQHKLPVPKKKDPLFHMVFEAEPEEYFRPDREVGIIMAIHSPDNIVNPFYDGFVVKPGNIYSVHLKVVEEKLLPFPYETRCKDYNSMWFTRGRKGPLSQEMCLGECVYNASMKLCNCVLPNIMYYHEDRTCTEEELDHCFDFDVNKCYNYCQQPCDFTDFEYDVQERKLENSLALTIEDFYDESAITNHRTVVMIFLKRPEIIIYNHRPQYEDIEVFSFMGGYVGMWLGVSLIAVFDFLESVFLISYFWVQRKLKIR